MEKEERVDLFELEKPVIKGFPELRWTGKRPYTSTQFFPAQLKETYGKPDSTGWINKIFWGDNLQVMSHLLKDYRGKIDLIYIDPPFDSSADYKMSIKLRGKKIKSDINSFEEKQYGDIWTNDEYLQFMYERLILLKELLSDNGSIYLHCDWHRGHQLRCLMDEVFGANNCKNEICWCYDKWTAPSVDSFQKNHDTILFYSKGKNSFNVQKEITSNLKEKYEKGYLFGGGGGSEGLVVYDPENPKAKELIASGKYKVVYAKQEGKPLADYWNIPFINPVAKERTNYPTQKPEALIERIILASSNPGDLVFDCFMGSGTTQAVALKLNRKFIGADINLGSIQTTSKRLIKIIKDMNNDFLKDTAGFEVYNVNNYDFFRNPIEAKELLMEALQIEKYSGNTPFDGELDGRKIKILPINRIATKADLEGVIHNLPYSKYEQAKDENPNDPVDHISLICMGHAPDLAGSFKQMIGNYNIDVEVVDILKDKNVLEFKRDSQAEIKFALGKIKIKNFYPMNLLQKLSMQKEEVDNWRQLVDSILIDYNYDGLVLSPQIIDVPEKNELVKGEYEIPRNHGRIIIKITDLLSESIEIEVK